MPSYGHKQDARALGAASRKNVDYESEARSANASGARIAMGLSRIALGAVFLWAFMDKLFGLGFGTSPDKAWLSGGSPTAGFLKFGSAGPFAGVFQGLAGNAFVDALFMAGLLGIGVALVLGIGVKVAGYSGALMMALMYLAAVPWAAEGSNNPLVDEHVVYALVLVGFALSGAGRALGLGEWWRRQAIVKRYPVLE